MGSVRKATGAAGGPPLSKGEGIRFRYQLEAARAVLQRSFHLVLRSG